MIRIEANGDIIHYDLGPEAVGHSGSHLTITDKAGTVIARYRNWERWTDLTHITSPN
ncbi:hypothetical protein [Galactobacter valiniphilus]|uniref:hypothetical protein n=1 Tax=Galactobacter valiniphilus TaxID=2676122 RepID=UPI003736F3F2